MSHVKWFDIKTIHQHFCTVTCVYSRLNDEQYVGSAGFRWISRAVVGVRWQGWNNPTIPWGPGWWVKGWRGDDEKMGGGRVVQFPGDSWPRNCGMGSIWGWLWPPGGDLGELRVTWGAPGGDTLFSRACIALDPVEWMCWKYHSDSLFSLQLLWGDLNSLDTSRLWRESVPQFYVGQSTRLTREVPCPRLVGWLAPQVPLTW